MATNTNDAGNGTDSASAATSQTGTIVEFVNPGTPVVGATVSAVLIGADGGVAATSTTDSNGKYTLDLPLNTPYSLNVAASSHFTLLEQTTQLITSADRGKTSLLDTSTGGVLEGTLAGYDPTLGVLSVAIINTNTDADAGGCATIGGGVITYTSTGDVSKAKIAYFDGPAPNASDTASVDGNFPSAVIWNLPVGVDITVSLSTVPTGCTVLPFPVQYTDPTSSTPSAPLQYNSPSVQTQAGNFTSFARIFLK